MKPIALNARTLGNGWRGGLHCAIALALGISGTFVMSDRTLAQITPDATLGAEGSLITPNVTIRGLPADRIDGGALRGANLFHSFTDFNIGEGLRIYFANPVGIENILTRVTGSNISNILGTLGVDGGASLFLLNPNGIIFGPNARLDIVGSFLASTAESVVFSNGFEFKAKNPEAPPLLTVSVPLGVQYGTNQPKAITNAGNLSVGQNLVLSGGAVTSSGQLTAPTGQVIVAAVAGDARVRDVTAQAATLFANNNLILEQSQLRTAGDLTLQALDTVRVRDSVETPFVAHAGGNLYIQGNNSIDILALNHPETPFQSGGNLSLVSDGNISGDAHFASVGLFQILNLNGDPGNFVSLYDPIISSFSDVNLGDYTGTSLKVETLGNITTGNITITGPDTALVGTDPDIPILRGGSALILRAGLTQLDNPPNFFPYAITNLGTLPGDSYSYTSGINNQGQVVGTSGGNTGTRAFLYSGGTMTNLGTLPGDSFSYAYGINDQGQVVGFSAGSNPPRAFLYTDGTMTNLGTLPGDNLSFAYGINNQGQVVGFSVGSNPPRAFLYTGGTMTNLGTLPGDSSSYAYGINDQGQVVGSSSGSNGTRAFLYTGGTMTNLGTLPEDNFSYAYGINNQGQVVGYSGGNNGGRAFLYSGGVMLDPNNLIPTSSGWNVSSVSAINDSGQIVGTGTIGGQSRAFIMSPNPTGGTVGVGTITVGNISSVANAPLTVIMSAKSDIQTGSMLTFGGNISLNSGGNINTLQTLNAFGSNGGGIALSANGNITTNGLSAFGYSGNGGNITLTSTNGTIDTTAGSLLSTGNNGGEIILSAYRAIVTNSLQSQGYSGTSGNITLTSTTGAINTTEGLSAQNFGGTNCNNNCNGGKVAFSAYGDITTKDIFSFAFQGSGGDILLNSERGTINTTAGRLQSGGYGASSGAIALSAYSNITTADISAASNAFSNAQSGNITLTSTIGSIDTTAGNLTSTKRGGKGGSINLFAEEGNIIAGNISTYAYYAGYQADGGDINIRGRTLSLTDGNQISAYVSGEGNAGNISVRAKDAVSISDGSRINTAVEYGLGNGGSIDITTSSLSLSNGAQLIANTFAQGNAGSISVRQANSVSLSDSSISTAVNSGAIGQGGDIEIQTVSLSLDDEAFLSASTSGQGNTGRISVQATGEIALRDNSQIKTSVETGAIGNSLEINLQTLKLSLNNNAQLTASTSGQGTAGNIVVRDAKTVSLDNSTISTAVNLKAEGEGGNVEIATDSLALDNKARISSSTAGVGNTGRVLVQAREAISLNNNSQILSVVESGAIGNSLEIELETRSLSLTNQAQVNASTSGQGNAGSIFVRNADRVSLSNSTISTESSVAGTAGEVAINTRHLTLEEGAKVSAATISSTGGSIILNGLDTLQVNNSLISASTQTGTAGNVTVNAKDSVELRSTLADGKPGGLLAEATQGGNASSLTIITGQLRLSDGAQATVSSTDTGNSGNLEVTARDVFLNNQAKLSAETQAGSGGNINLNSLDTLQVNNSLISASTQTGTAGNVTVNAKDSVELRGTGGLSVEGTDGGTAGNLTVNAGDMSVTDGAKVTVSSPTGVAGNLNINANSLFLNRGTLSAETGTSGAEGGANITLSGLDFLLMRNESLISANATGSANGGNITIDSQFIIALPPQGRQGSDIVANAVRGNGGRVNITTSGLFGIEFRPLRTPKNDITASSEFGVAGEVIINQLAVDPAQGLDALPENLVDVEGLINQDLCKPAREGSAFSVTGRGGLPENPLDILSPEATVVEWATPEGRQQGNHRQPPSSNLQPSTSNGQLVEAQGWIIAPDGTVILTAHSSSATPQSPGLILPNCQSRR
jgi:filamentous hemagglutinin family protein